ncbi:MAG: ATP-binding protein [Rubripirellula sp.]
MISAIENATWTVVISRGQSRNPEKRALEQSVVEAAEKVEGVNVLSIPHLYDLPRTSDSYEKLAELDGNLILVSWIYSRAAHWVLDRNGIGGQVGEVLLGAEDDDDEATEAEPDAEAREVDRVTDMHPRPDRKIHCIDLKTAGTSQALLGEIQRIVLGDSEIESRSLPIVSGEVTQVDETTSRRWYPVIDFSRCTNCMECVDFCLFGVYGVDSGENILVEQPDNCRKGCPACSRVCPENAIIFPQHKAPAIAGAEVEGGEGFKIDLSQLFGAPKSDENPIETAARERDEQLLLAGRETVGIDDNLKKRQADRVSQPNDKLDDLIDSLDQFDL